MGRWSRERALFGPAGHLVALDRGPGSFNVTSMLTLSLLRHAKSSWDDAGLDDHERPLAKRGTRDAPRVGALLRAESIIPDLILCSGAVRTRATLTLVLAQLERAPPHIVYDDAIYLAEPAALLARLAAIEPAVRHVMLVGHNPGLHALALAVTGAGEKKDLARLALGFPTAALAVIDVEAPGWDALAPGLGRLRLYVTPRSLDLR